MGNSYNHSSCAKQIINQRLVLLLDKSFDIPSMAHTTRWKICHAGEWLSRRHECMARYGRLAVKKRKTKEEGYASNLALMAIQSRLQIQSAGLSYKDPYVSKEKEKEMWSGTRYTNTKHTKLRTVIDSSIVLNVELLQSRYDETDLFLFVL